MTKPRPPRGNVASARGSLTGTVTLGKPSTAEWTLRYTGMTGKVVSASVRYPRTDGLVEQILLCAANCQSGVKIGTTFRSKALAQVLVNQALAGKADVVLTTKRNPAGEIRGVIKARAA